MARVLLTVCALSLLAACGHDGKAAEVKFHGTGPGPTESYWTPMQVEP